jgi:hypothetical protein
MLKKDVTEAERLARFYRAVDAWRGIAPRASVPVSIAADIPMAAPWWQTGNIGYEHEGREIEIQRHAGQTYARYRPFRDAPDLDD